MKLNLIILAAGKGSRFQSDDQQFAKPMIKILDKPLIDYVLDSCLKQESIEKKIIVVGYHKEAIISYLGDGYIYAVQETLNGTGGAILATQKFLDPDGYSLIMSGDTPLISSESVDGFIKAFKESKAEASIMVSELDNPSGYGRIIKRKKFLSTSQFCKIVEEKDANAKERKVKEINGGIYLFKNACLLNYLPQLKPNNQQKELYLPDVLSLMTKNKKKISLYSIKNSQELLGINNHHELAKAIEYINYQRNRSLAENGIEIVSFSSTFIGQYAKIDKGVKIAPNTIIRGHTVIGTKSIIGPNTELADCLIESSCLIRHSILSDTKIGKGTNVGPFAHLRNQTIIGEDCRIGNFVEVKKSRLSNQVKTAHLSYLGDATIGERVNIGCGVIIANYDGKNKHPTTIGKEAFIGCNSNLIAPICIAENAIVAAGSTLTDDVPAGALAIARSRQTIKENYRKKESS